MSREAEGERRQALIQMDVCSQQDELLAELSSELQATAHKLERSEGQAAQLQRECSQAQEAKAQLRCLPLAPL